MNKKRVLVLVFALVALFTLTACKSKEKDENIIKIGATPVPHAELLEFIKDDLKAEGITLEIVEFTDYVTPNLALSEGEIDANFFQHVPYMESFAKEHDLELVSIGAVHVEPLGLYSKTFTDISEITAGSTIAIPNDPTNEGRSLLLLEANGLIKLSPDATLEATEKDIIENSLDLKFEPIDAAQLPRSLDDVDAAIINTNYALEAELNPLEDALVLEGSESPYANILTVTPDRAEDEAILKVLKALQSEKVRAFIEENYKGAVVPAF